ncbi:unnamed protein product [Brugia timori]|uniref:CBM20 domain-containing protein n=1 Tax=Brugia timori TaxID=42155 RepID=A0A0R3QZH0_9BILA|nr:unnamed protein product [Brugia timori]
MFLQFCEIHFLLQISGQALTAQMSVAPRTVLHFLVEVEAVRPWEYVFVTGSLPVLGGWIPSNAFVLFPDPDSARQRWEGEVEIGLDPVKFRYFIGYYLHSGKKEEKNASFFFFLSREPRAKNKAKNALNECWIFLEISDILSHFENNFIVSAGKNLVSEASLMGKSQNEILLRFHGNPFKFCKKRYAERSYCIKVTPFDLRHREMFTYELKGRIAWQAWSCVVGFFEIIVNVYPYFCYNLLGLLLGQPYHYFKPSPEVIHKMAGSVDDDDNEENQDVMQPILPSYSVAHIAVTDIFAGQLMSSLRILYQNIKE